MGGNLQDDLLRRHGEPLELCETHISWVFLGEREVWKVKKPVSFGFLDFSTAELRRRACEAEVRLNRRLAPSVYLGVVPVIRDAVIRDAVIRDAVIRDATGGEAGRYRFGDAADAVDAVDWAVHMERLADSARVDRRLAAGELTSGDVRRIASRLASFHRTARCDRETAAFR